MNEILRKKHSRNVFLGVMAAFILCLWLIRYFVFPYIFTSLVSDWGTFASNILNGLVTSSIVTVLVGLFVFWLQPEIAKNAKIEIEDQNALGEMFATTFSKTDIWYYKRVGVGAIFALKHFLRLQSTPGRKHSQRRF